MGRPRDGWQWMKRKRPRKKSKKNARRKRPPPQVVDQIATVNETIRLIKERHP